MNSYIAQRDTKSEAELLKSLCRLSLELTLGCNLKCVHCYADSDVSRFKRDKLTPQDYKRLINEGRAAGCSAIQFIGGEATLNKNLPDFIRYAYALGYDSIEVFTNATYLTDELLNVFKETKTCMAFSFYSANEKLHDAITQVEGSFVRTVENIRKFVSAGIPLRGNIIVMQQNEKTVKDTISYLQKLNVRYVGLDRVRGVGRGKNATTRGGMDELCNNCWRGNLAISSEGISYPCIMSREFPVGNIRQMSLMDILDGSSLQEFRSLSYTKYLREKHRLNENGNDRLAISDNCSPDGCRPDVDLPPSVCCKPDGY